MVTLEGHLPRPAKTARILFLITSAMMLGACSQGGLLGDDQSASLAPRSADIETASTKSEIEKATEYWGKEFAKDPRDKKKALSFARNLKASGQKQTALAVLQQASVYHGSDREVASEYGRLALELDQVGLAGKILTVADDPAVPDWRVISARGTVHAKQGQYAEAIPFFERANTLAGGNPSVLNNLALAYAANGQADRGEAMLREALAGRADDPKIRQNLAIVLGLQGRHDEAKHLVATGPGADEGRSNVETLRQIVKAEPKAAPKAPINFAAQQSPVKSTVGATPPQAPKSLNEKEADEIIRRAMAASSAPQAAPAVAGWKKEAAKATAGAAKSGAGSSSALKPTAE